MFVLLGLSILIFVLSRVLPGDPVRAAIGVRAPEEVAERLRQQMHLDDPIPIQYGYWLLDAIQGDFGTSFVTHRPVADDIREFFPASLELILFAVFFSIIGGITLGTLAAHQKDRWGDNFIRIFSYLGVCTPQFVTAILLMLLFGLVLGWLPTIGRLSEGVLPPPTVTGMYTIDALLARQFDVYLDALKHILLPAMALALATMAQEARIHRASMSENLTKDYVANMRALGVGEWKIMSRFLLKPSLIPVVSIIALDFAGNLANGFLVELIFNWPGLSRYGMNAMLRKDLNAITAVVLVLGVVFVVVNILADLVVGKLDPRIRLRAASTE